MIFLGFFKIVFSIFFFFFTVFFFFLCVSVNNCEY